MLKRYQVLLPAWLMDYIKHNVDKYDLSLSETIRAEICCSILAAAPSLYPEYEPGLVCEDIFKLVKKNTHNNMGRDEKHRMLSKIYFEARKAIEYRLNKERKQKKT